jgi:hypothetical protein
MRVCPEAVSDGIKYALKIPTAPPLETIAPHPTSDISKAFDPGEPDFEEALEGEISVEPDADSKENEMPSEKPGAAEAKPKKAAATKKKAKKKANKRTVSRPPTTGSVQSASGPVSELTTEAVRHATALASQTRTWGDGPTRHQRERDRNPAVAALARGSIIRRVYKKTPYHIKVLRGRYLIEELNQEHWTLYSVMKAITGLYARGPEKKTNWSVPRFFKVALETALGGEKRVAPKKTGSRSKKKAKSKKKPKAKKSKKSKAKKKEKKPPAE